MGTFYTILHIITRYEATGNPLFLRPLNFTTHLPQTDWWTAVVAPASFSTLFCYALLTLNLVFLFLWITVSPWITTIL